ncbi:hypothetical protein [Viridibacillus arvi]|uniref:hypothetical protein n=1 Tax=Viridibacillus arvi TaxID=263475 RepID=UPI00187BC06A|nr:hypothetical protein [Viridibacillus sp. JNUCC-6]QOV12710.1 hypothetical protein JNUCC6_08145 [Viridibacillus sp. JNUCC-6]
MKKSTVFGLVTSVLFLAIFSFAIYTLIAKITDTSAIQIDEVEVYDGQTLHIKGDFTNSNKKYAGYTFDIIEDKFYLRMKTVLLGGKSGGFDFEIKDSNLANVKAVYLQGAKKEDRVLLWEPKK